MIGFVRDGDQGKINEAAEFIARVEELRDEAERNPA
jgi:hypothetical protein